jgi:hypothetical protein
LAEFHNWNRVLSIVRKIRTQHKLHKKLPGLGEDLSKVTTVKEQELLRKMRRPGWTKLPETPGDILKSVLMQTVFYFLFVVR